MAKRKKSNPKPWYTKWWFYVVVILFWLFLFKVIDILYLLRNPDATANTTLESADLLSYASSLFVSIITIFGVRIAAYYSNEHQKTQAKDAAYPRISVNMQTEQLNITDAKSLPGDIVVGTPHIVDQEYFKADRRYLFVFKTEAELVDALTSDQERKLGIFHKKSDGTFEHKMAQLFLIRLRNVGKEAAVNFYPSITIQGEKQRMSAIPTVFPVNNTFYIGLYIDRSDAKSADYDLVLNYEDIYGNRYKQKQMVEIRQDSVTISNDTTSMIPS